jgi:histone-lysine N-methyltransferase SETD1
VHKGENIVNCSNGIYNFQHHYGQIIQQAGGNVEVGVGGMADLPKSVSGKMQALSREARSNQRRLLTAFGIDTDSDLLKFNQLKVRPVYKILLV